MPDWITPRRCLLTLVCAAALIVSPTVAVGATKSVELRVTSPEATTLSNGATPAGLGATDLADHTQYTGTVQIKAGPGATCFGSGTGGSGAKTKVPGATALGVLKNALPADRDLRPLLVTDAFSFGLGLCGIGGYPAPATGFWYLKHNHAGALVGGDQLKLEKGDEVLWHLVPDFTQPIPAELVIDARARAKPGASFVVTVHEYSDDGTRSPAAGVTVTVGGSSVAQGAGAPVGLTDAAGKTTVTAGAAGRLALRASRGADIPAAEAGVCVADGAGCPTALGELIFGSNRKDRIKATGGDDVIKPLGGRDVVKARGGDDTVKVRGGGVDRIDCGPGDDLVRASKNDRPKANCERVKIA